MATYRDVWNLVALHADIPDPLMCRAWVQWAYNQFCDRRGWSHLRAQTTIQIADQKVGTCGVSQGSPQVLGSLAAGGLRFVSTDANRQFRTGSIPIYTIIAVDPAAGGGAGVATLDRPYSASSASAAAAIVLDAYVTMPADFHRFLSILDPVNRWRLRWDVPMSMLDSWDPARTSSGNPRLLANHSYTPVPSASNMPLYERPRYELYPFQTSARAFPVWYYRKPELLGDDVVITGPLATSSNVLVDGALSRCALWPGTAAKKNPYFSLQLAEYHRKLFEDRLVEIAVTDENLFFEELPLTQFGWAEFPWDAAWLQQHEPYMIG